MVGLGRNTLSDMDEPAWIARGGAYGVNVPKGAAKKLVLVFRPPYKTGHKISTTEPPPWTWIEGFVQAPAILPTLFTPSTKVDDDNPSNEHEKELDNNIGELREEIRELTTVNKQLKSSLQKRVGHLEYEITFLRKENKLMAKQVKDQGKRSEVQLDLLNRENSNLRLKILSLTSQLELRGEIPKSTSLSLDW